MRLLVRETSFIGHQKFSEIKIISSQDLADFICWKCDVDQKVGFDIGGVISKYPELFRGAFRLLKEWKKSDGGPYFPLLIITDMYLDVAMSSLSNNGFDEFFPLDAIYCAEWMKNGEACKYMIHKELKTHMFFDDYPSYLEGVEIGCLVMPDLTLPYYSTSWQGSFSPLLENSFRKRVVNGTIQ